MKQSIQIKFLLVFALISLSIFGQEINLSSLFIPSNLKENANAVIRLQETFVTIEANDEMTTKGKRIITVLNKSGISLEAIVYNALGKKMKKF